MRRAFTVVELLVVIAIISTLIAILLPAVQFAREVSRKSTCSNNLKQIAMAANMHANTFEYLPNAGGRDGAVRSKTSDGRPQGALQQDWGVFYQILPYVEQQAVYEAATDADAAAAKLKIYSCPTRRPPGQVKGSTANGLAATSLRGTIDYAGNGGSEAINKAVTPPEAATFTPIDPGYTKSLSYQTGVIIPRRGITPMQVISKVTSSEIADGLSNVVMFGERQYNRNPPPPGPQQDEDNGYFNGWSWDTIRFGFMGKPETDRFQSKVSYSYKFGGPHSGLTVIAMADGSVRSLRHHQVDDDIFRLLTNRRDGQIAQIKE